MKLELIKKTTQSATGVEVVYCIYKDDRYVYDSATTKESEAIFFLERLKDESFKIKTEEVITTIEL